MGKEFMKNIPGVQHLGLSPNDIEKRMGFFETTKENGFDIIEDKIQV